MKTLRSFISKRRGCSWLKTVIFISCSKRKGERKQAVLHRESWLLAVTPFQRTRRRRPSARETLPGGETKHMVAEMRSPGESSGDRPTSILRKQIDVEYRIAGVSVISILLLAFDVCLQLALFYHFNT